MAAWNCGDPGSIPLFGPSWPGWPLGSGKFGTPWARMHAANSTVKLPTDPPCPLPGGAEAPVLTEF
ncbi:hypothetical protein Raf01_77070 [Rugosimonospora africana]|uniref:Uncharacterized protein n=1 Tax=Rugosimonospora africana TaxID=556532 RepID=A0A8J3R1A2_9ACTN|nr:hypothetical protein Raf01_77070 [Rugosimonospora africana]